MAKPNLSGDNHVQDCMYANLGEDIFGSGSDEEIFEDDESVDDEDSVLTQEQLYEIWQRQKVELAALDELKI